MEVGDCLFWARIMGFHALGFGFIGQKPIEYGIKT